MSCRYLFTGKRLLLLSLCSLFSVLSLWGQGRGWTVRFEVTDANTREPVSYASVLLKGGERTWGTSADENGLAQLKALPSLSKVRVTVRSVGYKEFVQFVSIGEHKTIKVALRPDDHLLGEVVVTARESFKPVTAVKINRQSIDLLQPSSFSDLLSLLPGGMTQSPSLSGINNIRLREAGAPSGADYNTSSLGTAFEVDGVPVNTDANLQSYTNRVWSRSNDRRSGAVQNIGTGVDMRGISTDDIESVEVQRGIPSVEYGNLTSGLIRIKRKMADYKPVSRFKADTKSKLLYSAIGLGWNQDRSLLNLSLDYLHSNLSPVNSFLNFQRLTASARYRQLFSVGSYEAQWMQTLDYGGTFDNEKNDPEQLYNKDDRFRTANNRASLSSSFSFSSPTSLLQQVDIQANLSAQWDDTYERRFVSTVRINPITTVLEGESDAIFAPKEYIGEVHVEGRPVTAFLKATFRMAPWKGNRLMMGAEYSFSKNFGRGTYYDVTRPIDLGLATRLRPLYKIPAQNKGALFVENLGKWQLSTQAQLQTMVGIRMQLMSAPRNYAVAYRPYFDPRANIRYQHTFHLLSAPLTIGVNAGGGLLTMLPSAAFLYPPEIYADLVELNYYSLKPENRRIHFRTYALDISSYDVTPPRNQKLELRVDALWSGYSFSLTAFREDMKNGYRGMARVASFTYNRYDASGIDHSALVGPPNLVDLPVVIDTATLLYDVTSNGSRTFKRGIEWQLATPRFSSWGTRITWNGAWFLTRYENSLPFLYRPNVVVNGRELPVIGVYRHDTGYTYASLNTSVMMDTYIPRLDLILATTFESLFFGRRVVAPQGRMPFKYIDREGNEHPFTEDLLHDPILKQLVREGYSEPSVHREPFVAFINFKATKQFFSKRIGVALFVNRLVAIEPTYKQSGYAVRRSSTPYFGMELNVRL